MEVRNTILTNGGKVILCYEVAKTWLNCGHILMFCGRLSLQIIKPDISLKLFITTVFKVIFGSS